MTMVQSFLLEPRAVGPARYDRGSVDLRLLQNGPEVAPDAAVL